MCDQGGYVEQNSQKHDTAAEEHAGAWGYDVEHMVY